MGVSKISIPLKPVDNSFVTDVLFYSYFFELGAEDSTLTSVGQLAMKISLHDLCHCMCSFKTSTVYPARAELHYSVDYNESQQRPAKWLLVILDGLFDMATIFGVSHMLDA